MPTVSVIVPNYNHAPFLKQRIDSILEQTFQDFELILLDDGSTDNSRDIMEQYRNNSHVSHIVYNEANSGSAFHQWKKGIELAQGEWVWIAESDDWAEPEFLTTMLTESDRHPKCGLLFSLPCYVYPNGSTWKDNADGSAIDHHGSDFARQRMLHNNAIHNVSSTLMRRNDLQKVSLESCTSMRLCGDWLLYCQLCSVTNVLEVRRTLCYYRIHQTNVSTHAEQDGLPMIEGVKVLNYLTHSFAIPARSYARTWGRSWAKLERRHQYCSDLRNTIQQLMHSYPAIRGWHRIYQLRLWLK